MLLTNYKNDLHKLHISNPSSIDDLAQFLALRGKKTKNISTTNKNHNLGHHLRQNTKKSIIRS